MKNNQISHNVYFKLKDDSASAVDRFIADCHTYLKPIPGIYYFAVGRLLAEHDREVNVKDFDVGIHVSFIDEKSHDEYQICDLHNTFVERNKDNWETVKVFDMYADYSG